MDFAPNSQQSAIQEMARAFAHEFLTPTVARRDRLRLVDGSLYEKAAALGLNAVFWPKKYGGLNADYTSYMLACVELSKADDGFAFCLTASSMLFGWPVLAFGTEEQKQRWLRQAKMGAFCLSEKKAGSNAAALRTTARRDNDHYIINGAKVFVTNACEADFFLVITKTAHDESSAFVIEKDTPGLKLEAQAKMGVNTVSMGTVSFHDLRIPAANLLGKPGQGMKIAMAVVNGGRLSISAQALGICLSALKLCLHYGKELHYQGRALMDYQATQFTLADMATRIEALRLLLYRLAWLRDQNREHSLEAASTKLCGARTAIAVTSQAMQILSDYSYLVECDLERLYRNAHMLAYGGGTSQIQRLIIARHLLRDCQPGGA